MKRLIDLTGNRFGKLIAVSCISRTMQKLRHRNQVRTVWLCRCDCGKEKEVEIHSLTRGKVRSCGCLRNTQGGHSNKHPLWRTFTKMHARCEIEKDENYKHYGARGIRVCDRWKSFENFLADMMPTHKRGLTLDRKDNNGPYSPNNCRWATAKEQSRNRRNSIMIDTPWGRMNVAEAAERIGVARRLFLSRVKLGWTTEQLFDPRYRDPLTKLDRRRG